MEFRVTRSSQFFDEKPRNVKNTTERLEMNRYCSRCKKHTVHKEKK